MHSLYVVEHRDSGRCYVGWTSKPVTTRWSKHKSYALHKRQTYFHKALCKYGIAAFEWRVLQCFDSEAEARCAEVYWIERLREFGVPVYNLTDGGQGTVGYRHSDETKAKISAATKSQPPAFKGKTHSAESKARQSAAKKGKPSPLRGTTMSEGQRAKLRGPKSEAHRAKLSEANMGHPSYWKGRTLSEEHRAKISASRQGQPSAFKGRSHSGGSKEKIRLAALARHRTENSDLQLSFTVDPGDSRSSVAVAPSDHDPAIDSNTKF